MTTTKTEAIRQWTRVAATLKLGSGFERCFQKLWDNYTTDRVYHGIDHIMYGLDVLAKLRADALTRVAWWFHDSVYVPGSPTNEADSADLYRDWYDIFPIHDDGGADFDDEVRRLVMLTKTHDPEPFDVRGVWITVADLYGLGASWDVYTANGAKVKAEFNVLEPIWREGRLAWLRTMTNRDRIFPDRPELAALELQAQRNLLKEMHELERARG
jgi:predicted metal-dependent HD superfamily phosphohydrolase